MIKPGVQFDSSLLDNNLGALTREGQTIKSGGKQALSHDKLVEAAKAFESTTILFTDVVGFTKISESITPNRLVYKLDILFKKFDRYDW